MLVVVTRRSFWYVSLVEPVVVVHLYLFRRRPAGRGGGGGGGVLIFFRPSQPSRQISSVGTCHLFFCMQTRAWWSVVARNKRI